jgi:hypothetical protein
MSSAETGKSYLAVECITCHRMLPFQEVPSVEEMAELPVTTEGQLSIDCPHCGTHFEFSIDQVLRLQVTRKH